MNWIRDKDSFLPQGAIPRHRFSRKVVERYLLTKKSVTARARCNPPSDQCSIRNPPMKNRNFVAVSVPCTAVNRRRNECMRIHIVAFDSDGGTEFRVP
ncbi:hypothetical protein BJ165DRAFT_1499048 [Panaeolus papilionaceus]|nr:hypothetical protein BJ165DRAFT_1499048 [Panaeolus papilionaceus]